jgi:beta-glucanase (GH16 family)
MLLGLKTFCSFGCLFILLAAMARSQEDNGKLVWIDEFDGKSLDYSKWEIEINAFGGGNQELQIYTDRADNVRVENGLLVIQAHRQRTGIAGTERDFSSGRIRSKRRGDWKYGRFEARMKLPAGQGLWPAFWMLPSDEKYGTWASSGEVDIMEFKGQEVDTLWGTLHHGGSWPRNKHTGLTKKFDGLDFTKDFHVFGVEWEPGEFRWSLDGKIWQVQKEWGTENGSFPQPFDQPFHIVLNLAVGGEFVGPVAGDTEFPAQMLVDWVKVYQK